MTMIQVNTVFKYMLTLPVIAPLLIGNCPKADANEYYKAFPSVEFYDVDAELRRMNVQPERVETSNRIANWKLDRNAKQEVQVFVIEQRLDDFLKLAGRRNNVSIKVSRSIRGTIRNMSLPGDLNTMLSKLSDYFEFAWYRDANTVHVVSRDQVVSRIIGLDRMSFDQLSATMEDVGLSGSGFEIRHVAESNSVLVDAPAELIAKIELLVESRKSKSGGPKLIKFGKSQ